MMMKQKEQRQRQRWKMEWAGSVGTGLCLASVAQGGLAGLSAAAHVSHSGTAPLAGSTVRINSSCSINCSDQFKLFGSIVDVARWCIASPRWLTSDFGGFWFLFACVCDDDW